MLSAVGWQAEHEVLTTEPGRRLLEEMASSPAPAPAEIVRWRKVHREELVSAALRLSAGHRKAQGKFSNPGRLWLTPTGAEQATPEPVANHKAARFAGTRNAIVMDLCCGVGGDALALAQAGPRVIGVDLDPGMAHRVAYNAASRDLADRVLAVIANAEHLAIPNDVLIHVDPDRRAGGRDRRARLLADYQPGIAFLRHLMTSTRGGALKLGPASDFEGLSTSMPVPVEVELISLKGECKEATVWYGQLAGTTPRRATTLPSGDSFTGDPESAPFCPVAREITGWVYDPDPALLRSGLLPQFACASHLARVLPGCDYLTSPNLMVSPWLRAYRVEAVEALDRKRLKRLLGHAGVGSVEIKIRGVSLSPEVVRGWFNPNRRGVPATLLLCGGAGATCAILAIRPPRA